MEKKNLADRRDVWYWLLLGCAAALLAAGFALKLDWGLEPWRELLGALLSVATVALLALAAWLLGIGRLARRAPWLCYALLLAAALVYALATWSWGSGREWLPPLLAAALALPVYALRGRGLWGVLLSAVAALPVLILGWRLGATPGLAVPALTLAALLTVSAATGWFGVGRRTNTLCALLLLLLVALCAGLVVEDYMWRRLAVLLDPYSDPNGEGYLSIAVRETLSRSAFLGGGGGTFPLDWTREHYALTYAAWRWGWGVMALALLVCAALLTAGYLLCRRKRGLARCVALSAVTALTAQTLLYGLQNFGFGVVGADALPLLSGRPLTVLASALLVWLTVGLESWKPERRPAGRLELFMNRLFTLWDEPEDEDAAAVDCDAEAVDCAEEPEPEAQAPERPKAPASEPEIDIALDKPSEAAAPAALKDETPDTAAAPTASPGQGQLLLSLLPLPESAAEIKRQLCPGEGGIALTGEDVDALAAGQTQCLFVRCSGNPGSFEALLGKLRLNYKRVLLSLTLNDSVTFETVNALASLVSDAVHPDAQILFGAAFDSTLPEGECVLRLYCAESGQEDGD